MRKSARILGQDIGLNAQEMNYLLKEEGFLDGEAGNYTVTEKGAPFAEEQDHHRGTGGYAYYNRHWTTRSWDESISNALDITEDKVYNAKAAVAADRQQQWSEIKADRAKADAIFLESLNQEENELDDEPPGKVAGFLVGVLIAGVGAAVGYGAYKIASRIVDWWKRRKPSEAETAIVQLRKMKELGIIPCPACEATLRLEEETGIWKCQGCDYFVSSSSLENSIGFWFCDECEAFLNIQDFFSTEDNTWVCTECGFSNDVSDENTNQ